MDPSRAAEGDEAKRAMELLWQATDKKRRRRIRALPKSLSVILAVLLVGCGPSETKHAAQECEAASTTTDYDLALAKCHNAVRLDPFNKRLVALKRMRVEALDARPVVSERSSYYLLERFVPGDVYHVDSLVQNGEVIFCGAHRYLRPPMQVAHHGGVFVTSTVERGSADEHALHTINRELLRTLGLVRGATHAEFIRGTDGRFYFLEVAARVGGAYIAEMLEAASRINLWREWANVELSRDEAPYQLPPTRRDYAGVALALARQEWPDTGAYTDPEIIHRVRKRHHVGLIVRSPDLSRVQALLDSYVQRFTEDFLAVLPPMDRPE